MAELWHHYFDDIFHCVSTVFFMFDNSAFKDAFVNVAKRIILYVNVFDILRS